MPDLVPGSLVSSIDRHLWVVVVLSTLCWVSVLKTVVSSWWIFPLIKVTFVSSDCFGLKFVFRYYSSI